MDIRHEAQVRLIKRRVFYTGTDALEQGIGLCYDRDYGTAADPESLRDWRVNRPTTADNTAFAGVTIQSHAAKTGGQWIEIAEPGSICYISVAIATVVNATRLTAMVGAGGRGVFGTYGLPGRGSALALQTKEAGTSLTTPDVVLGSYVAGSITLSADGLTVTDGDSADLFTWTADGDEILFICMGSVAGAVAGTAGRYIIDSKTSASVAVLKTAASAAVTSAVAFLRRGNPMVLALLDDGSVESGLVEYIEAVNNAVSTCMAGGMTNIMGTQTLASGTSTSALADRTRIGEYKRFKMNGALTTNGYVVTLATTGEKLDGTTNLDTLTFETDADEALLMWKGPFFQADAIVATAMG